MPDCEVAAVVCSADGLKRADQLTSFEYYLIPVLTHSEYLLGR